MKRILLTLALVVLAIAAGLVWFVNRVPPSAFDGAGAGPAVTPALLAQGEGVARQADCVACHSTPQSQPFAGGLKMGTPLGAIFATNITPDKVSGIGAYTLADFDRAVRHGVTPDGRRLYPAMPYPSYVKMSDEDIAALYAFFMQGVAPVAQPDQPSEIPWPLNMRWPLALWNAVFVPAGVYADKPGQDAQWNRGAYLVQAAGHCGACHTPRGLVMNEKALDETGAAFLSGAVLDGWFAPSLRQDHNTGLGRWSEDEIVAFLANGRNRHAVVTGSMTEAFNNSLQFLSDADLRAMAHYLKSLPGDAQRDGPPWSYAPETGSAEAPGAQIYAAKCSFCHGADGRGQNQWIPPLAGAASSLAPQGVSQVNVTLNGSARVVANGIPDSYRMPPYRAQLSDQQISEVLSFVRSAWGNHGGPVTAQEVAELRGHTDPASSNPIVLQMR